MVRETSREQLSSAAGFSLDPGAGNAKRIEVEDGG